MTEIGEFREKCKRELRRDAIDPDRRPTVPSHMKLSELCSDLSIYYPPNIGESGEDYAAGMFSRCSCLLEMADFSRSAVTDLSFAYLDCDALTETKPIPDQVKQAESICENCSSLKKACDLPKSLVSGKKAFANCGALEVPARIPEGALYIDGMYAGCKSLDWAVPIPESVVSARDMYDGCKPDVQKAGKWNFEHRGKDYYIDGPGKDHAPEGYLDWKLEQYGPIDIENAALKAVKAKDKLLDHFNKGEHEDLFTVDMPADGKHHFSDSDKTVESGDQPNVSYEDESAAGAVFRKNLDKVNAKSDEKRVREAFAREMSADFDGTTVKPANKIKFTEEQKVKFREIKANMDAKKTEPQTSDESAKKSGKLTFTDEQKAKFREIKTNRDAEKTEQHSGDEPTKKSGRLTFTEEQRTKFREIAEKRNADKAAAFFGVSGEPSDGKGHPGNNGPDPT